MKFVLISDVHVDIHAWDWSCMDGLDPGVKTVLVAGDISNDVWETSRWILDLKQRFENVVWVAGNHDFYNLGFHQTRLHDPEHAAKWPYPSCVPEIRDHYRKWSDEHGIHFLSRGKVEIDGVIIAGATGWHDYVAGAPYSTEQQIQLWYKGLNDRMIKWWSDQTIPDHLAPMDEGIKDFEFLRSAVKNTDGPMIIMTHHMPGRQFCWQKPHDPIWTMLHGSFANTRMESIQDQRIRYWVYGHTHERGMRDFGPTSFVCNARGYPGETKNWEPIILEV